MKRSDYDGWDAAGCAYYAQTVPACYGPFGPGMGMGQTSKAKAKMDSKKSMAGQPCTRGRTVARDGCTPKKKGAKKKRGGKKAAAKKKGAKKKARKQAAASVDLSRLRTQADIERAKEEVKRRVSGAKRDGYLAALDGSTTRAVDALRSMRNLGKDGMADAIGQMFTPDEISEAYKKLTGLSASSEDAIADFAKQGQARKADAEARRVERVIGGLRSRQDMLSAVWSEAAAAEPGADRDALMEFTRAYNSGDMKRAGAIIADLSSGDSAASRLASHIRQNWNSARERRQPLGSGDAPRKR